ncbi:MAG: hypothetical protein R2849_06820 [Thermomicrobiales bacterium]
MVHYARISRLDLIQGVVGEIAVPGAVWNEVVDEGLAHPGSSDIYEATWIHRIAIAGSPLLTDLHIQLDHGESEAIALAYGHSRSIPLIVDERRARRIARSLGLQIIGSAGLLLLAKQHGLITGVIRSRDECFLYLYPQCDALPWYGRTMLGTKFR